MGECTAEPVTTSLLSHISSKSPPLVITYMIYIVIRCVRARVRFCYKNVVPFTQCFITNLDMGQTPPFSNAKV